MSEQYVSTYVVACMDEDGNPDLFFARIRATEDEHRSRGKHVVAALTLSSGRHAPLLVYDEDNPCWAGLNLMAPGDIKIVNFPKSWNKSLDRSHGDEVN